MESMTLLWQRIERWLATHAPHILDRFNPGVSEEELAQTEAALGVTFPENLKASYRIHNGGCCLPPWQETLSLADMVGTWGMFKEYWDQDDHDPFLDKPPGPVQPFHWHPKWIPFLWSGYGGEYLCFDLAPGPGGQLGQVVRRLHESDPAEFIANSFEVLLSQVADDLEAGKYLILSGQLEERLTEGKEARAQARRYDCEQPSAGKQLLEQALRPEWQGRIVSEDEKIVLAQQVMAKYMQVLQMELASVVDRFQAYHNLILLYRNELQRVARVKSTGQRLNQAAVRQVEETYRPEAERLLAAFEVEAKQMPVEHWVHDDLEQAIAEVFGARHVLNLACQSIAKGDLESAAALALSLTMHQNETRFTAEEQFEIYALFTDVYLRQQQREQAKLVLAQFAAEARKRPPKDPVHEMVRYWTTRLQQVSGDLEESEN
jgi:cell wall assembly regulator SMI1